MTINFGKYAQTGKEFINKVAYELGDDDNTEKASRILCSTLHVLRSQSTPEESMQLISQLPMAIKAIYVDGWQLGSKEGRVRHWDDFVSAMHKTHRKTYQTDDVDDFINKHDCVQAVHSVLRVLKEYVSEGEMSDFLLTLPENLRVLFDD